MGSELAQLRFGTQRSPWHSPDPTAVHKLGRHLWLDGQNVWATFLRALVRDHGEIIILAIESCAFPVCGFRSFVLGFEQPLQYVIDDPGGPTLGKDLKLFRVRRLVAYVHNHASVGRRPERPSIRSRPDFERELAPLPVPTSVPSIARN